MKMYEKLGIDLTTPEGFLKAHQTCKKELGEKCDESFHCSKCTRDYLFQEIPEEKYRPYKNIYEMMENFNGQASISIIDKNKKYKQLVVNYTNKSIEIHGEEDLSFDSLLDNYTYLDGSPIGKKE